MSTAEQATELSTLQNLPRPKARRTDVEFYLRNVARRWKREVSGSDCVILLSPYLTSKTAEAVLKTTLGERCKVYTAFKAENFAAGASSIDTLIALQERGCEIYDVPRLHAKILLVPDSFASIGSQNVTRGGTLNKEATAVFTEPDAVEEIQALIEPWLEEALLVTTDMITDMKLSLPPLIRAMRKTQRACAAMDAKILAAEQERAEERARIEREALARVEAEKKRQEEERLAEDFRRLEQEWREATIRKVAVVRTKADSTFGNGIDWDTAARFVSASTWWLTHRYRPVRARNHCYRISDSEGDWRLPLGANTFHVEYAIGSCVTSLGLWLDRHLSGQGAPVANLRNSLKFAIRGSVSNYRGDFYEYYAAGGEDMAFGGTAVDVKDFIDCFLDMVGVDIRFPF